MADVTFDVAVVGSCNVDLIRSVNIRLKSAMLKFRKIENAK